MAAKTSIVTGISGRYAVALFDLANEQKMLDQVVVDLDRIKALIEQSADLARLVSSPVFGREEQGRAIAAVLEKAGIGDLVRRFVGVIAQNRRLSHLLDIIADYGALLAQHRGETAAKVVSATPLNPTQIGALTKALRDAVGRDVTLAAHVDPSLIGGLVVQLGSRMVDASVRAKLDNLKVVMKGVA